MLQREIEDQHLLMFLTFLKRGAHFENNWKNTLAMRKMLWWTQGLNVSI